MVECRASWEDDAEHKARIWELLRSTPEPVGYDPSTFWESADDANFGVMKLEPWRLELWSLADMAARREPLVWRGDS